MPFVHLIKTKYSTSLYLLSLVFYPLILYATILTNPQTLSIIMRQNRKSYTTTSETNSDKNTINLEHKNGFTFRTEVQLPLRMISFLKWETYPKALELCEEKRQRRPRNPPTGPKNIIGQKRKQENWNLSDLPLAYTTALYFRFFALK